MPARALRAQLRPAPAPRELPRAQLPGGPSPATGPRSAGHSPAAATPRTRGFLAQTAERGWTPATAHPCVEEGGLAGRRGRRAPDWPAIAGDGGRPWQSFLRVALAAAQAPAVAPPGILVAAEPLACSPELAFACEQVRGASARPALAALVGPDERRRPLWLLQTMDVVHVEPLIADRAGGVRVDARVDAVSWASLLLARASALDTGARRSRSTNRT